MRCDRIRKVGVVSFILGFAQPAKQSKRNRLKLKHSHKPEVGRNRTRQEFFEHLRLFGVKLKQHKS